MTRKIASNSSSLPGLRWLRAGAALSICLAIVTAAPGAAADAPSVSDFAQKPAISEVALSPDGNRIAVEMHDRDSYCMDAQKRVLPPDSCAAKDRHYEVRTSVRTLRRLDPQAGDASHFLVPAGMQVRWLDWASDDTLLVSLTTPFRFEGRKFYFPSTRVVSISASQSREPVVLFDGENRILSSNLALDRVVDMLPEDADHIIMGARRNDDLDLFRVNVNTGASDRIAKGKSRTLSWTTDASGAPAIRMDCTTRSCRKINAYRPADGADPNDERTDWVRFRSFKTTERGEERILDLLPLGATTTPDEFFVMDYSETAPRRAVRVYNIRTDQMVRTVFEDPDYDVETASVHPVTHELAMAQIWRDRVDYHLGDAALAKHLRAINRFFDDAWNVSLRQVALDRSAALVFASAHDEPGGYYLYDFDTNIVSPVGAVSPGVTDRLRHTTRRIDLPMRDGTTITGYHTSPKANARNRLIVMIHGGPEARDRLDYDRDTAFLASRGYDVLRLNFRGSSGYGRAFAEAGYRQWGGVMHTDIVDATRHMQAVTAATPETSCIMGYSYGGYAALLAGARQASLYNCVIAGGGPSDLVQVLKDERDDHGRKSDSVRYWSKSIGDRKADKAMLQASSPIHMASSFDDPVFIVHGKTDRVVSVEHSQRMVERLEDAGVDVEYLELPNGHGGWSTRSTERYLDGLERFLDRAFAASATAPSEAAPR